MSKFLFYKRPCSMSYPIGEDMDVFNEFVSQVYDKICHLYSDQMHTAKILLIGRGSSGMTTCGAVAFLLKNKGFDIRIIVCRKEKENSHGINLSGLKIDYGKPIITVILDDFIQSGDTINKILSDMREKGYNETCDVLCVSNDYSGAFRKDGSYFPIIQNFKHVCLNRLPKSKKDDDSD